MSDAVEQAWIANFWRRLGAFFLDSLILCVVGFLLGLFLEDYFVKLGDWGRLVGFVIAFPYFAILNSTLGSGQTLGKRVLKIRVVNAQNTTLSLTLSGIRYAILSVPFLLNGAGFGSDQSILSTVFLSIISLAVFGGGLSILYLYLFNRKTRQSLHDIVVGSYVVNVDVEKQETEAIWKVHYGVVALLCIISLVLPGVSFFAQQNQVLEDMLFLQREVLKEPLVSQASVMKGVSNFKMSDEEAKTVTYVNVRAFVTDKNIENETLARELASLVAKSYPEAPGLDLIRVTFTYGYNIGIWSQWYNYYYNFNPAELSEKAVTDHLK
ncbi:RDD family protein [Litoribacillus peritrichatus]|uniref:RDD domain-containing protein n=1 Tax=Litoribacillus peritrichatus TaxID=718191 RepID=A0ABP7N307_9GAMM